VAEIAAKLPSQDYKFSQLVLGIVNSLPFQMRSAREAAPVTASMGNRSK
jgi:hypothetical protein